MYLLPPIKDTILKYVIDIINRKERRERREKKVRERREKGGEGCQNLLASKIL